VNTAKIALLAGGSRGLGQEIAKSLALTSQSWQRAINAALSYSTVLNIVGIPDKTLITPLPPTIVKARSLTLTSCLVLTMIGMTGCNSERVASGPSSLREQEVVRLRASDPGKVPVVYGLVQAVDEAGRYPVPKALVSIDGQPSYTNETGTYRTALTPGSHQFITSQTGMRSVRTTVKLERGDSVQVNFYLRLVD